MDDLLARLRAGWIKPSHTPLEFAEAADEIESLRKERDSFRTAYLEWSDKTEWIQDTAQPKELGKHRAEVMRERIESLREEVRKWSDRYYSLWSNVGIVNDCTFTDWAAEVNEMYREEE